MKLLNSLGIIPEIPIQLNRIRLKISEEYKKKDLIVCVVDPSFVALTKELNQRSITLL